MLSNQIVTGREMIVLVAGFCFAAVGSRALAANDPEPKPTPTELAFFESKIRPVLVERCYSCHSKSAGKGEGEVQLDSAEATRRGGTNGPAIVPLNPGASRLLLTVQRQEPRARALSKHFLLPRVVSDFDAWIRMGAPDPRTGVRAPSSSLPPTQGHWAFQPSVATVPPTVKGNLNSPIDQFILAELGKRHLEPAPPATRSVWLRRVTLDLTGLPPTPQEVEAFLADPSPTAYAVVVDRLLNAPEFGEQWGRHWLQWIQYADQSNLGSDLSDQAWHYRDYVIAAFNSDKPYDLFIREQLAGDLFADSNEALIREHLIATGFLVLATHPSPMEFRPAQFVIDAADDQVQAVTRTFLGLSVSCARCHDHKTDPVSTREYYGLAGIFTSTSSLSGLDDEFHRGPPRWREHSLATPEERLRVSEYEEQLRQLRDRVQAAREMKQEFPGEIDSAQLSGTVVDNLAAEIAGAWKESNYSTNFVDRNYLHDGNAEKGKKTARFTPDLPADGLYDVFISYTPRANRATNVPVTINGKLRSKTIFMDQTRIPTVDKVFAPVGRFAFAAGTNGSVLISNAGTKGFVVVDAVRFVPAAAATHAGADFKQPDPEAALTNYRQLESELRELLSKKPILPTALAVEEGKIRNLRIQLHGDPEKLGDFVPRGFPSIFKTPPSTAYAITDESSGRWELASWLSGPAAPLAARVAVNRVWQQLFGRGLVDPGDDLGRAGARPSHPELLEYLASRFIQQGWSFKKLIREIALTRVYQMSSAPTGADSADPQNELVHRMNGRPVEAGVLRDVVLAVAGQLDRTRGGTWLPADSNDTSLQNARQVQLSSRRRTVYLPLLRGAAAGEIRSAFEAASEPAARAVTGSLRTTAGKSVFDPGWIDQQARDWGRSIMAVQNTDLSNKVVSAYKSALTRGPSQQELTAALEILNRSVRPGRNDADLSKSWEVFCEGLLKSDPISFEE